MRTIETYFGKPCKYNHVNRKGLTERMCSSGMCLKCNREKARKHHRTKGWLHRKMNREPRQYRAASPSQLALPY